MLRLSLGLHFLCFFLVLLKRGTCRDWFVSPSKGLDDVSCGTESHPCRTYSFVIEAQRDFSGLSILLECGQHNTYYECVPDRPNGHPGGIKVVLPYSTTLNISTWGNCSKDYAYIDCQRKGSAFWIQSRISTSHVILRNIVFANGSTVHQFVIPDRGSALTVNGYVDLTVENTVFYGNYNESDDVSTANAKPSPVIFIGQEAQSFNSDGSVSLTLRGCVFRNNSNGVHVSSDYDVIAVVEGSTFHYNVGHYSSSSLYFATKALLNLSIRGCHFESNLQLQNGSVVNIQGGHWSNISILDTKFDNNQGVFLFDASNTTYDILMGVVMININLSHVSAEHSNSSIRFKRVSLINNYFPHRGGGFDIRCYYGGPKSAMDIVMDHVQMKNNTGYWHGGGVTIMSSANTFVLIRGSTFIGNKALGKISYGGALYVSGSTTVIESCTFVNNSALSGTTLFLDEYHYTCEIKDSILESDLPQNATNIVHALSGSLLRLSNSTIHATRGHSSTIAVMTREPLVLGYKPKHYIELFHGSKIVCPVKYNSIRNTTMPFAHLNVFHCRMCPGTTYTLGAAQTSDYASTNRTDLECFDCPGGGYCHTGDIHSRHNNWCYQEQFGSMKRFTCISCKPNRCCGQYICDNPQSCSGNREGTACGQCKEGFSLAFRLLDAIKVTDKCYPNDLLRSSVGSLICVIVFPILATLVYFGFYLFRCCHKIHKYSGACKKRGSCCKCKCKLSLFTTLQNIVFFFYPTFFAYEVNDGIFNVFSHVQIQDINFSIFCPPISTRHDSEAAFQLLCLLFILPILTLVFILVTLLCQLCQKVEKPSTENANASSKGLVETEKHTVVYTNASFQGLDNTEEIPSESAHVSSQERNEIVEPPSGNANASDQGLDDAGGATSENTNTGDQGRDDAGEPQSGNTNNSAHGRDRTAEHQSGKARERSRSDTQDIHTSCLPCVTTDRFEDDIKGTFLYICVKYYFSLWHFFYGLISPTVVSLLVPTYAEKGLYREFTDGSISPTNGHLIAFSVFLILFLGIYPLVVMYLSYNRCKKVCELNCCCHGCPCKVCKRGCCRSVIRFSFSILPGLPTLPLGLIMLVMSCFKCFCKRNCQCPSKLLMTCITTVFDEIAQEGRNDEPKSKENEEGQRKSNQNDENQKCKQINNQYKEDPNYNQKDNKNEENQNYKQKNNQNNCICTCKFNTACLHGFLLSAWEGFEMLYLFIFTTVSKVTLNNQAVRIPILISLSGAHLFFVTWTRPFKYPYANIVYALSSLTLVIVGAFNAIQVGDFGTGHPLAISEEVLKGVDVAQLVFLFFPLLMCLSLIARSAYKTCRCGGKEDKKREKRQPTICLKSGSEMSTESQSVI